MYVVTAGCKMKRFGEHQIRHSSACGDDRNWPFPLSSWKGQLDAQALLQSA